MVGGTFDVWSRGMNTLDAIGFLARRPRETIAAGVD
jgi:hypothetical protein